MKYNPHLILLIILYLVSYQATSASETNFTSTQKSWIYRITKNSPTIKANCIDCFQLNINTYPQTVNSTIYSYIIQNPDCLKIDWQKLKTKPQGVLSELAVKLALYQLNEHLDSALYSPSPMNDSLVIQFSKNLTPHLPQKHSKNKKRKQFVIETIINPSYPVIKKLEALESYSVLVKDQKKLMTEWTDILYDYIEASSRYFYTLLTKPNVLFEMNMLAAGEGSGTAGLLNERNINPKDSTMQWYGKATGLFTYHYKTKKDKIIPLEQTNVTIKTPTNKDYALHMSLWGLNSTTKPMIIVQKDNKTYQLFVPGKLTPDSSHGEGLTHINRIEQYRDLKINKPIVKLNEEGGLNDIIDKELILKTKIENIIHSHELSIDSLRKQKELNQFQIDYHKSKIDTYLSNLTAKEIRINELTQKLTDKYRQINIEKEIVAEMEEALGKNIQRWTKEKNLFHFQDGTIFNYGTQDLIFPGEELSSDLSIRLISPSLIIGGQLKDEVQMIVTLVDSELPELEETSLKISDTLYYNSDGFNAIKNIRPEIDSVLQSTDRIKTIAIKAQIDTSYLNKNLENYHSMRISYIECHLKNDSLSINITSGCDPDRTKIVNLDSEIKRLLNIQSYSQNNNKYLATLRCLYVINQLNLPPAIVEFDFSSVLQLLSKKEFDLLNDHVTKSKY